MNEPQDVPGVSVQVSVGAKGLARRRVRDYLALTKPEINALIVISTFAGACLASATSKTPFAFASLLNAVFGTALVASGAAALNQAMEERFDANMSRTMRRPVAAGRITALNAFFFGSALAAAGTVWLFELVGGSAALFALLALGIYLMAYTPLKRATPLCVSIGAVAGAIPPLIGWTACGGALDLTAGLLFALLFLWQFPHFMAIAWICKKDYERAGYHVIPADRLQRPVVVLSTILPALGLLALTVFAAFARGELLYLPVVGLLGIGFLVFCVRLVWLRTNSAARHLLTASIYYLPLALALLVLMERHPIS